MDRSRKELTLNADPDDQARLLDLQALDTRLDQLDHQQHQLPQTRQIADLDLRLAELRDERIAAETSVQDLSRTVAKAEREVKAVTDRAARDLTLLDSGQITQARQLEELQHEVASLRRRQSELEDAELEIMQEAENAGKRVAAAVSGIEAAQAQRAEAESARDHALAGIDTERADTRGQRDKIAGSIAASELLALYERLRRDLGGVGAAQLLRRRCEGCRLDMPPSELARIRAAAAEEVVRCDECRRILVRTQDSGL